MTILPLLSQFRQFCPLCETIKPFCYVCAVCSGNVSFLKGYTLQCSAVYLHPLPTRRQSFEDLSGWRNRFLRPVPAFSLIIPHSIVFGHPSLFFDQMPSVSDENLPRLLFSRFFLVARKLTCSMNIVHQSIIPISLFTLYLHQHYQQDQFHWKSSTPSKTFVLCWYITIHH